MFKTLLISLALAATFGGLAGCGAKPALDTKTEAGSHANAISQALDESNGDWSKVSPETKKKLVAEYGSEELAQEAVEKMAKAQKMNSSENK